MTVSHRRRRRSCALVGLGVLLAAGALAPRAALTQEGSRPAPDLATLEERYEEGFAAALEMSDPDPLETEPMWVIQAWSTVIQSAVMLENVRAQHEGGEAPTRSIAAEAAERVLDRWQRLRPEAGGPDLMRALQIGDTAERRAAVVALLDRHPDDLMVVSTASHQLRSGGDSGRATEVLEGYLARHPDRPVAYRMLAGHFGSLDNETRQAEVFGRWAQAFPGDPGLVERWMESSLPRTEPEATARRLDEFFAARPGGGAALDVCRRVARSGPPSHAGAARACLARLAGDPEEPAVADRATSALVELAAEEGDGSALRSALETLPPEARLQAAISAAGRLEAPDRCSERIDLLAAVRSELPTDGSRHRGLVQALQGCGARPAGAALYLDLLASVPAEKAPGVIRAWTYRRNDVLRGEVPPVAAQVLEQRLQAEPGAVELYEALDVVYQLDDPGARRFELLRRWQERFPESFDGEQAVALAEELLWRGEADAAILALERQLEHGRHFDREVAETLGWLYLEQAGREQAARFAAGLIAGGTRSRAAAGNLLAARLALLDEEYDAAEHHYWEAAGGGVARRDVAVEMLSAVAAGGGEERLGDLARRLCEETPLGEGRDGVSGCTAELLAEAGSGEAAAGLLRERARELPDDVRALRELASTARTAGQLDVAEQALRRIVEVDPRNEAGWINLGAFLEKQERLDDLERHLERARSELRTPPVYLLRSVGRARIAAGDRQRGLEALQEARRVLPPGAEPGWIDAELRTAYEALGRELPASAPAEAPSAEAAREPSAAEPAGRTAEEMLAAAEALQSGSAGRYDPEAALELFERAAATRDPLAGFRLALLQRFGRAARVDAAQAETLHRRSRDAVEALAEQGDPYAQYLVGSAALVGLGTPKDPTAARRWLERAASEGESWAWHNLAWMQETGQAFERADPEASIAGYRRASELGNAVSMLNVARLTLTDDGSGEPCAEGLRWLERAARTGYPSAAAFLGKLLFYGRGRCVAVAPERAVEWLEAGAAADRVGADCDLGLALLTGAAGEDGVARAVAVLERAVERREPLAAEALAFAFATGVGTARDPERGRHWIAEAARLGSDGFPRLGEARQSPPVARFFARGLARLEALAADDDPAAAGLLARLYSGGGVGWDWERAVALARPAAEAGDPEAMRILAYAYEHGHGVEQDTTRALGWWRRGAEAGNGFSMMFYAHILLDGELVERDLDAGLRWLTRAGEAGNWWAVGDLGRLYDEGWHGLPRDPDRAASWKRIRARGGDAEARGWLAAHGYPLE